VAQKLESHIGKIIMNWKDFEIDITVLDTSKTVSVSDEETLQINFKKVLSNILRETIHEDNFKISNDGMNFKINLTSDHVTRGQFDTIKNKIKSMGVGTSIRHGYNPKRDLKKYGPGPVHWYLYEVGDNSFSKKEINIKLISLR
jgi:hypothetical protein